MTEIKGVKGIVSFSEVRGFSNPFETEKVARLDEYINKRILIKDFKIEEGENFNFVFILAIDPETKEEITLRTTSRVIEKQLRQIEKYLKEGMAVEATVRKRKRYLTFE